MGFFVTFLASWAHAYAKEGKQVLQCFFLLSLPYKRVWPSKKPVRCRFFWRRVAQYVVQIDYACANKGLVVLYLAGALLSGLSYGMVLLTPPSLNPITLAE